MVTYLKLLKSQEPEQEQEQDQGPKKYPELLKIAQEPEGFIEGYKSSVRETREEE